MLLYGIHGVRKELATFLLFRAILCFNSFYHPHRTNLGLDMNGTHQVLAYADDVNLIGDAIRTIERNADVLLNACKDIGLAVHIGKTKYMEIGRHRGMIANAHIKIGSNSYEKVET